MGPLAAQVKELIEGHFNGAQADVEESPEGRVFGSVVWDGFKGLEHADRQQTVRDFLRQQLHAQIVNRGVLLGGDSLPM